MIRKVSGVLVGVAPFIAGVAANAQSSTGSTTGSTTPVDLTTVGTTLQGNVTSYITQVAPYAFVVLAVMIGIGLLMRMIKKASKSA